MDISGRISLTESTIRYNSAIYGNWELNLDDVRVIGEMTNEMGPCSDDYFICFVTREQRWLEASCYADGFSAFFSNLAEKLGPLQTQLCSSTTFASNILWPQHLAEKPLFRFTELPYKTFVGRIFGIPRVLQELAPEVLLATTSA